MRITSNVKQVVADLKKISQDNRERLTYMVIQAAADLADIASDETPAAPEDWEIRSWYVNVYKERMQRYQIAMEPGFHKGAWVYSPNSSFDLEPQIRSFDTVPGQVRDDMNYAYNLGEGFYIGAKGPGFAGIERGLSPKAPEGVMQPTIDRIIDIYKMNLAMYYKRG